MYAEAAFYDLAFSVEKAVVNFNADTPEVPMAYALSGTDWSVGNVTVRTKRTWQSTEKNTLSILRQVQNIHGGDLIFDCANHLVHLMAFGGTDSGVLFAYRKNMKSIQHVVDITRLYAYGKDGMTFASINGGKEYVESYAYTNEVRTSTLDCSSFTNPYQMLEFAQMRLADYAKPRISYVLSAMDLSVLTGYVIHTETMMKKFRENGEIVPPRFYNGLVRSNATLVAFNLGQTSAGLDVKVYPVQNMAAGSIELSLGTGAHKAKFLSAVSGACNHP